jgi:rhamnosyltransferase
MKKTISVIIPTLNAEEQIHGLLISLKNQSVPCEIILIDSSSSDLTVRTADSLGAKSIIIRREDFDHGRTRNLGASHAAGDIMVFLTQDALPEDRHVLENLIRPLEDPTIAASYGRQVPRPGAKPTEKFARLFNYPEIPCIKNKEDIPSLGIKAFFFSNVCSAIRKKDFEEIGGFTERLIMNEDMLLACRLILKGYKIAYVPEARVIHSHNYTLSHQFKRYFDIGVFLKKNLQPLEDVKTGNAGAGFLKEEIKYFLRNRAYTCFPYILVETAAKYLGYQFGLYHANIPNSLRKRMSMHRGFWE